MTPKGCPSVEGGTATKAWSALFTSQDSARALGFSGAKQFGLQHPRVQRLLQALPGAAGCERYAAWLGPTPPVPTLVRVHCLRLTLSHYRTAVHTAFRHLCNFNALRSLLANILLPSFQRCMSQQVSRHELPSFVVMLCVLHHSERPYSVVECLCEGTHLTVMHEQCTRSCIPRLLNVHCSALHT